MALHTLNKSVTTAGTRVALASSRTLASWATVQAKQANAGAVYIGDVTVTNGSGAVIGHRLDNMASKQLDQPSSGYLDLSQVYIDADTSGDGVSVTYALR